MRNIVVDAAIAIAAGLASNPEYGRRLYTETRPSGRLAEDVVFKAECLVTRLRERGAIKEPEPNHIDLLQRATTAPAPLCLEILRQYEGNFEAACRHLLRRPGDTP